MDKSMVLGQEVFVLSAEGEVVRTMVAQIGSDGHYVFLNGRTDYDPHWTSFRAAMNAALSRLEARREVLRKQLRQLAAKNREFQTEGYRRSVASAPYKMVDLDPGYNGKRFRPRMRKHVAVPDSYMRPGQRVYAIITPRTPPHSSSGWAVHRPYGHFVLETEVRSVRLSPNGAALYTYTTPFRPDECFPSRAEATERLRSYSESGMLEEVHFVSMEEEKKALDELAEEDNPF